MENSDGNDVQKKLPRKKGFSEKSEYDEDDVEFVDSDGIYEYDAISKIMIMMSRI